MRRAWYVGKILLERYTRKWKTHLIPLVSALTYSQSGVPLCAAPPARYDLRMRATVYVLGRGGRRTRDHQGVAGELHLESVLSGSESHSLARLCSRAQLSSRTEDLIPPLYEPRLVAIGTDALMLRGFESSEGAGHVQEWHCVVE